MVHQSRGSFVDNTVISGRKGLFVPLACLVLALVGCSGVAVQGQAAMMQGLG